MCRFLELTGEDFVTGSDCDASIIANPLPTGRRRRADRTAPAIGVSVGVHVLLLAAFLLARTATPPMNASQPVIVSLVRPPPPPPPVVQAPHVVHPTARAAAPAAAAPIKPVHADAKAVSPLAVTRAPPGLSPELSDSELAGAATAGGGGGDGAGGSGCDMAGRLQAALRKDAAVQAAILSAHVSRAVRIWSGEWMPSGGEDGKGLAVLREAIAWEVAFAPAACRSEPMHGLVLISTNAAPGAPRLALGKGEWRWSDLLK